MGPAFAPSLAACVAAPASHWIGGPPRRACRRRSAPLRAPVARASALALAPTPEAVRAAADEVDQLYGDAEDENQEYHRWRMAQDDIEESRAGLLQDMHASELVFGEFDLHLLGAALRFACGALGEAASGDARRTFVDVGSGYGRCVLAGASMLGDDWSCCGIEIVPGMVEYSSQMLAEARARPEFPWSSRVRFVAGDYSAAGGEAERALAAADVVFCFATTWPSGGTPYLTTASSVLGRRMRHGAIVMTADKQLAREELGRDGARFELLHHIDGKNQCVGESTVYVHRLCRPQL
jgi:hypothetical protein